MKNLNYNEIIAYASAFVSFILPKIRVNEVILFGSVARKEATENSDIDLFFNVEENEKEIKELLKNELKRFYKTKIFEIFHQKDAILPISIEVGNLDNWKLKRSIIGNSITLYGKYKSMPGKVKTFTYFSISTIKNIAKRNKITRKLFGRKEKSYSTDSLVLSLGGKKLTPLSFLVPQEKSPEILKFLQAEKIDFSFFTIWTDEIVS